MGLNGPTDYRRHRLGDGKRWFVPADAAATEALSAAFFRLTDYPPEDRAHVPSLDLDVGGGRTLHVPKAISEEHTSELQSLMRISYAVFCLTTNTNARRRTSLHCRLL